MLLNVFIIIVIIVFGLIHSVQIYLEELFTRYSEFFFSSRHIKLQNQ